MTNKEIIKKLKDNAELAQAAYGYFHLIGKVFDNKDENKGRKNKEITQTDILDITYNGYITSEHITLINPEKLNGDFTPLQAKRFFERYELIHHIPNTTISGFSATLFYDDCAKNYTLAFRGTESIRI